MQSLGEIEERAPVVGAKKWCLYVCFFVTLWVRRAVGSRVVYFEQALRHSLFVHFDSVFTFFGRDYPFRFTRGQLLPARVVRPWPWTWPRGQVFWPWPWPWDFWPWPWGFRPWPCVSSLGLVQSQGQSDQYSSKHSVSRYNYTNSTLVYTSVRDCLLICCGLIEFWSTLFTKR